MRASVCKGCGRPMDVRTLDQNSRLWAMLTELSRQVEWYGQRLRPEEWKDVMTAALKKQRAVPGIDGVEYWISGWIKTGENGKWLSLSFKPKEEAPTTRRAKDEPGDAPDSDLPFR